MITVANRIFIEYGCFMHVNPFTVTRLFTPGNEWMFPWQDAQIRITRTESMVLNVAGRRIETDPQGYLCNLSQWSEEFAEEIAGRDGIELYNDHWEMIWYFRDYYDQNESAPTMHTMVKTLGKKDAHHHEKKAYEKHVYSLFPKDPIHEICKLSGLPMPQPDD
jgi:tRNA 2-thiouridine synthesizing protein E